MAVFVVDITCRSDWLILGNYSPVMPRGRLWACKNKVKSHITNNLLTSNVWTFSGLAIREFMKTTMAVAMRTSLNKRFNEQNNG